MVIKNHTFKLQSNICRQSASSKLFWSWSSLWDLPVDIPFEYLHPKMLSMEGGSNPFQTGLKPSLISGSDLDMYGDLDPTRYFTLSSSRTRAKLHSTFSIAAAVCYFSSLESWPCFLCFSFQLWSSPATSNIKRPSPVFIWVVCVSATSLRILVSSRLRFSFQI